MNNNAKHETCNIKKIKYLNRKYLNKVCEHQNGYTPSKKSQDWNQPGSVIIKCFKMYNFTSVCSVSSGSLMDHSCRRGRPLVRTVVGAYLWHTGSTSPRWWGRWGGRSSWRCRGCCRSWCDGWGRRCPPPRNCLLCDMPPDSGYNASGVLDGEAEKRGWLLTFFTLHMYNVFLVNGSLRPLVCDIAHTELWKGAEFLRIN